MNAFERVDPSLIVPAGWQAQLDLVFARQPGRTALVRCAHRGPLRVQRALYPEAPSVCHVIVLHPPAGIVGGDVLGLSVTVEAGAHALLTTPGAGKWYRSAGAQARFLQHFQVGAQGICEWLPQESMLYSGALGVQDVAVRLDETACFISSDMLCLGRQASGERFEQGAYRSTVRVSTPSRTLWLERGGVRGGDALLQSPVGLMGYPVVGTLLMASARCDAALLAACRAVPAPEGEGVCGVTLLPGLLVARWLGVHAEVGRAWFERVWAVARAPLTGQPWQRPRIWNT